MLAEMIERLKTNKLLNEFFNEKTFQQLIKYIIVGMTSFITEWSLLYIFNKVLQVWYLYANSIAFVVVFWLNFLMNRIWAFQSRQNFKKQILLYGILFIINLNVSNAVMYWLHEIIGLDVMLAKVFAVGLVVSWNFILYKKVIYR
jgi:putative flippase GtrA